MRLKKSKSLEKLRYPTLLLCFMTVLLLKMGQNQQLPLKYLIKSTRYSVQSRVSSLRYLKVSWFENDLLVSSNLPKNTFVFRISASASKKRSNKKIRALYIANWRILFWHFYTTFLIWTLFRGKERNPGKKIFVYLGDLKTPKGHF